MRLSIGNEDAFSIELTEGGLSVQLGGCCWGVDVSRTLRVPREPAFWSDTSPHAVSGRFWLWRFVADRVPPQTVLATRMEG